MFPLSAVIFLFSFLFFSFFFSFFFLFSFLFSFLWFLFFSKIKQTKNLYIKKETSCPISQCLNGGKCSIRFNGNYSCQCSSPYTGINCQLGCLLLHNFLFIAFSNYCSQFKRKNGFKRSNNLSEFL